MDYGNSVWFPVLKKDIRGYPKERNPTVAWFTAFMLYVWKKTRGTEFANIIVLTKKRSYSSLQNSKWYWRYITRQILRIFSSPEPKVGLVGLCRPYVCVLYVCQHFQTSSPLKPLGRLKPNFIWSLLGTGERKFVQTVQVTLPRWPPPCPCIVKTLKNLLLQNQKADDLETWYAASGARVLPSLFKWWPWVDLDLFYGKVKFGPLCFCMGKR